MEIIVHSIPSFHALTRHLRENILPDMERSHAAYAEVIDKHKAAVLALRAKIEREEQHIRQTTWHPKEDAIPQDTAALQSAIEEQYQLIAKQEWHRREIERARAELQQKKEQDAHMQALAPQIQTRLQQRLADIQQRQKRNISDVKTVCLDDLVRQAMEHPELHPLDALQYIAQGRSRATVEVPAVEQEHYGKLLHDCERQSGESLQACAERGKAEFTQKYREYGREPQMLYVSPDDNTTLSFFEVSLPRRESPTLLDGHMIVEG